TSDNPRTEQPEAIIKDIISGIDTNTDSFIVESDRREAIKIGVTNLKKGDVLIIAGKGHETYQILNDRTIDFNDELIAREFL
ncbi:UDP-N-acetylmuramoyl-L-alanyl-D-glutamate--2,6-diaminopimelate ligase, partial [bacterium]|nr:UDP-N-acetylmuramoyl-L-alanyl-D-glutamate--2,6-diaminopimelate ligase [bacterium]